MEYSKEFEECWKILEKELSEKTFIHNWTYVHDHIGEDFTALWVKAPLAVEGDYIDVEPHSAKKNQRVRKHSVYNVYKYWIGYSGGRIERSCLSDYKKNPDATRHSKYIISMLHQFENKIFSK